jgi:lipid-binding SYLF domain-containing protein
MRIRNILMTFMAGLMLALATAGAQAQGEGHAAKQEGLLLMASQVLEDMRGSRDQAIPQRLLERAYGIAVIPDVTKAAFFLGGRHGNGVLIVRDSDGRFTNPFFISITGGSFGWQWGVQKADIVLVFTTRRGIDGITGGKVTLGADASVAAGPVGRSASAGTDAGFSAEVYSYSRTRGLFAGLALDGSAITIDNDANEAFYNKRGVLASEIASGAVKANYEAARRFLEAVATGTGSGQAAITSGAPAPAPIPVRAPAGAAQPSPLTSESPEAHEAQAPPPQSAPQPQH